MSQLSNISGLNVLIPALYSYLLKHSTSFRKPKIGISKKKKKHTNNSLTKRYVNGYDRPSTLRYDTEAVNILAKTKMRRRTKG